VRNLLRHFQETLERINQERRRHWGEADRAGEPPDLLPRFTFHELRHTAASLLHVQGVGLKTASEILGHAEVGLTADTYSQLYDEGLADAADRMDGACRDDWTSTYRPTTRAIGMTPPAPTRANRDRPAPG
jgi:integrase